MEGNNGDYDRFFRNVSFSADDFKYHNSSHKTFWLKLFQSGWNSDIVRVGEFMKPNRIGGSAPWD